MTVDFKYYLNRQGVPGRQGEKGEQGFSPIVTIQEDTLSSYVLAIQTEGNYIVTPNLREHKEDLGGTYIRYNRETGVMYAGEATNADELTFGVVRFATDADIERNDDTTAVTPNNVNSIISNKGLISAEDLQTYLQPGSNITFTINDGVITINGEAGGNYTEGTGIDITGRVISVDFSAVATAAQGAKADSAVQPAALNNYYTKSATDSLLDEKQDAFATSLPLEMKSVVTGNVVGMSFVNNDKRYVYSTQYGVDYRNDGSHIQKHQPQPVPLPPPTTVWTRQELFTSYIDIPYSLNQTIEAGQYMELYTGGNADGFATVYGILENGEFTPVLFEDADTPNPTLVINTSDNITIEDEAARYAEEDYEYYAEFGATQITLKPTSSSSVSASWLANALPEEYLRAYGAVSQIVDSGDAITVSFCTVNGSIFRAVVTDSTLMARIRQINTARVLPQFDRGSVSSAPSTTSDAYYIGQLGVYNYSSLIDSTAMTTPGSLGENQYEIDQPSTTSNVLKLHIGAGLAVQSGNLVNTNPTAPDLSSYYTKSETDILLNQKPDFADIPVVGNGTITFTQGGVTKGTITTNQSGDATIALDAGGGSSYTEGTGIDITSNVISVEASLLQQIATMQDLINQYSYRISALEASINGGNSDLSGSALPTPSSVSLSSMSPNLFGALNTQDIDLVQNDLLEENNIENNDDNNNNNNDEEA